MKRVSAILLALCLLLVVNSQAVFAGSSSTEHNQYVISVSCSTSSSSHEISERGTSSWPFGRASVTVSRYGVIQVKNVSGSSSSSTWSAYYTATNGEVIIKAKTTAFGVTVTATP